jgi:hypothetical protein
MNPLLILGLTGLLYLLYQAKNNILNRLTISFSGIVPDIINLRLKLKLAINNPLPTEIPITTITGSVSVAGKPVAEFSNTSGIILVPGQNIVEISAFPLLANVVSSASSLLKGRIDVNYTLTSGPFSYTDSIFLLV